jgi:hypothetical protein
LVKEIRQAAIEGKIISRNNRNNKNNMLPPRPTVEPVSEKII